MRRHALCLVLLLAGSASLASLPGTAAIDARVRAAMVETRANGMAIAVISDLCSAKPASASGACLSRLAGALSA